MKKGLITLLFLCFGSLVWAQEDNKVEFKMTLGDTIVWKPFTECNMFNYKIQGDKIISFKPLHLGEKIEIVALKAGKSSIIATCQQYNNEAVANITITDPNDTPVVIKKAAKPAKPATKPFTGTYKYNPPTDNFFITINDSGSKFNETYMKHGDDEAYNDGQGIDRFWNIKTGKSWYYRPEAQGWTVDTDWEFEPLGANLSIINSFDSEVNKDKLSNYYVGTEKVLDIDCWHFFVDFKDGTVIQYWVDPANGCTLKYQINADPAKIVTVYDLNYTKLYFGPSFKKGLHDTTR